MVSYGFKGEPWAEQRRELERSFDRAGRSDHNGLLNRSVSMSSGLPHAPAAQRQHSASPAGYGYARHSGYGLGSSHLHRPDYASLGRTYPPQDRLMQYREHLDSSRRSVSSRTSSPTSSYASRHIYSRGYAPSSSYSPTYQTHSRSSRHYGYSGSESSTSYSPLSFHDTDDDEEYAHIHAPPSAAESGPHFASGYAEPTFIVEPSDSGSEASYSGEHTSSSYDDSASERGSGSSGYSGSDVYSDGSDDEYDDGGSYSDGGDCYSDDGGYYSDD
jgi:hypothetical protein